MPRSLAALKITIKLHPTTGKHLYPDFNTLDTVIASGLDWSHYVDQMGTGWHYDRCCGHSIETVESKLGEQFGLLLVPVLFAIQAMSVFPDVVQRVTEVEVAEFYDDHAHAHEPPRQIDTNYILALKALRDLNIILLPEEDDALDPSKDKPGVRLNHNRRWIDYKALHSIDFR